MKIYRLLILTLLLLIIGCDDTSPAPTQLPSSQGSTATTDGAALLAPTLPPAPTAIPPTPTATPIPLAATVNGEPLLLADFETAVAYYTQLLGPEFEGNVRLTAFTNLVESRFIEQAAFEMGFTVTNDELDADILDTFSTYTPEEKEKWLADNHFTIQSYRQLLQEQKLAAKVIAAVVAEVPNSAEYVRARFIQTDSAERAQEALAQLQGGADFDTVLDLYSTHPNKDFDRGDLAYFDRGLLLIPEIETAAFALQIGEISPVVSHTTADGITHWYIVQTTDRDPAHAHSPQRIEQLRGSAFPNWLATKWESATIDYFINFE